MIIRISDPYKDAHALVEAAKDFVSRMDVTDCFPKDPHDFIDALSRILLADYVDVIVAEHEGEIVGTIGMAYVPHVWNPELLHAEELFWWAAQDAPKTTGMRLLKFVKQHSKERGANVITFRKLTSSPEKVAKVYERMGLREIETVYSGLL